MSCFLFLCKYCFCKRCFIRSFPGIFWSFQVMPGFSASYRIFILLFCAAGMISIGQTHPQPALFLHKDDFFRPDDTVQSFSLYARWVTVGTAPLASVCRRQLCRSQAEAKRLSPPRRVPATLCATCVRLQKTALRHFFTLALPSENVPDQSDKITSAFRE